MDKTAQINHICEMLDRANILSRGDRVVSLPDGRVGLDVNGKFTTMSRDLLLALVGTFKAE
jgi:hypothetical protein